MPTGNPSSRATPPAAPPLPPSNRGASFQGVGRGRATRSPPRDHAGAARKRLRNRIAASKCRRRKLERIARLEEKVKALKGQNAELAATANLLRAQVTQLQGRVRSHLSSGCHINAAGHPPPTAGQREAPPEAVAPPETSAC
uniref:Transcription factor JunB n=1 Tax=Amazona collaria TaxID=241587 RepID=A0A8B9ISI4_9PSIT